MSARLAEFSAYYSNRMSYDEVAEKFKRLSDAGLDGMAISTVNYVQEMPIIRNEVLPRLERLGLRQPLH